jgi:signal transduction histidine kinase
LGLEAALKWLGENMEKQHGFRVTFSRQGESGNLDEESSVFLFSAVRELLVNVAKHASATEVHLRLRWSDNHVNIVARDNGRGFRRNALGEAADPALGIAGSNDGFGLFNIQERVSDLGGRVWMRSEPFRGTTVKIQLPLSETLQPTQLAHEHQNIAG